MLILSSVFHLLSSRHQSNSPDDCSLSSWQTLLILRGTRLLLPSLKVVLLCFNTGHETCKPVPLGGQLRLQVQWPRLYRYLPSRGWSQARSAPALSEDTPTGCDGDDLPEAESKGQTPLGQGKFRTTQNRWRKRLCGWSGNAPVTTETQDGGGRLSGSQHCGITSVISSSRQPRGAVDRALLPLYRWGQ